MNIINDKKIDLNALLAKYHKKKQDVARRSFKAVLVGNSEACIGVDGCTQTQQPQRDSSAHTQQLKMPSYNFDFYEDRKYYIDKNKLQQYELNVQANRESFDVRSIPDSAHAYTNSVYSSDRLKMSPNKSLHSETFYKLSPSNIGLSAELNVDDLTSSATYTNHQVKIRRKKYAEKMTYCRPVTNMFNQEFIYKTMEKQRKLQTLVKKLVEARKRERETVWDKYIRELKIKHGVISDGAGPSSIVSPIQAPSSRPTEQILEDYYNTKYAPAESFHCKDLLKDIYDSNIMHTDNLVIALRKNKGVNTEGAKVTTPTLYKPKPYFCYPTASQAHLHKYGYYNCSDKCETAAGMRPFIAGPRHYHGDIDTRKYLGNYVYVPLSKRRRRKSRKVCDCNDEHYPKRTAGTETDGSRISEEYDNVVNDNAINEMTEIKMLQNENIQTEISEDSNLKEQGSFGDQNVIVGKVSEIEKSDQNAELGQPIEGQNERRQSEQQAERRISTGGQNKNKPRRSDDRSETAGTKLRSQGGGSQRPSVSDKGDKLNSLKEEYAIVSNNVARLKERNENQKANLDPDHLEKIENKLDLLIIAINSLIAGIHENDAKFKIGVSRKTLNDAKQINTELQEIQGGRDSAMRSKNLTRQHTTPTQKSTTPGPLEQSENILDRIKKTNYRCNMSGCTSARCLMRRKLGEDTVRTAEYFNENERKELISAAEGSASECISKPTNAPCCRFQTDQVNLAILDTNYKRSASDKLPNGNSFRSDTSESFENKNENSHSNPSKRSNSRHGVKINNKTPFGFTKEDEYVCEIITDQSVLRFTDNFMSDSMKIDKILNEEMNKSDQAKRDIEEILNGESNQTCAVQISFDIPTRECCTEVTDSLSKTRMAQDKSVEVIPPRRSKSRGLSIAVNTDPLSILALIKISTEAIWKVLTDMHLDCYSFLSLIQSPQITRVLTAREPQYICDICGAVFRKPSQLSEHIRGHQSGTSRDCCVCRHLLELRQQRSTGLFVCQYCGQCFTRAYCRELHEQKCAKKQGQVHDIPENLAILR